MKRIDKAVKSWLEKRDGRSGEVIRAHFDAMVNKIVWAACRRDGRADFDDLYALASGEVFFAIKKYDPSVAGLSTYVYMRVARRVQNWRRREVGCRPVWENARQIYQKRVELTKKLGRIPDNSEIVAELPGVSEDVVSALFSGFHIAPVFSDVVSGTGLDMDPDRLRLRLTTSASEVLARSPEEIVLEHESECSDELNACVAKLSPSLRKTIDLLFYQGASYRGAGKELGVSQTTISGYREKALAALRTKMRAAV